MTAKHARHEAALETAKFICSVAFCRRSPIPCSATRGGWPSSASTQGARVPHVSPFGDMGFEKPNHQISATDLHWDIPIPGLKVQTWGTQSSLASQTWAARLDRAVNWALVAGAGNPGRLAQTSWPNHRGEGLGETIRGWKVFCHWSALVTLTNFLKRASSRARRKRSLSDVTRRLQCRTRSRFAFTNLNGPDPSLRAHRSVLLLSGMRFVAPGESGPVPSNAGSVLNGGTTMNGLSLVTNAESEDVQ